MTIDSDKIFSKLPTHGFGEENLPRARAELIQHLRLEKPPRIEYNGSNNRAKLTERGLMWARSVKDDILYSDYRIL
jgi:hypothetical protein